VSVATLYRNFPSREAVIEAVYAAGAALLSRAQAEGTARTDVDIDTAMRFIMAVSLGVYTSDAQRDAILGFAVAGLHVTGPQGE
jgi:AcrR family transcriptional regulator